MRRGRPGVAFVYQRRLGGVVTAILIFVVGLAIVAGVVGLMMWVDRVHRRRVERRREAWEASGGVGAEPDDYIGLI